MDKPTRKHMRLMDFDYSNSGAYFITICTHNRQKLLGLIQNGTLDLSPIGNVVEITWKNLENHFDINVDEYVIMPNYFHGIIWVNPRTKEETPTLKTTRKSSLISIVQTFKSLSSKRIHSLGYPNQVWQRSYYETIIRDDEHLNSTREYIQNNPVTWALDEEFLS